MTREEILSGWMYEHSQMVIRTAYYYVKDAMIAEDIAQEVFLRAYGKLDEFRGDSAVSTWLYRITVNASKDYLRSWNYRKTVVVEKIREWGNRHADHQETTEQLVVRRMEDDHLARHVMQLPVKYREMIVLYYFEQLKSREIAELLDMNESTVRVRLKRALEQLKKMMTGGDVHEALGRTAK